MLLHNRFDSAVNGPQRDPLGMSHKRLPNSPLENGCVESKLFQDHESILRTDEVWYDWHYGKYALSYACRKECHSGWVVNPLGVSEIVISFIVFFKSLNLKMLSIFPITVRAPS